jgi:NADH-quinone oxidoreductase subunit E
MLTEEERKEIEEEVRKYGRKRAAGPEALKIVQQRRGWISDECLRDIAEFLGLTNEELDSVATCYSLVFRKPVGKHVILLCDSVTCWIMGYEKILEHITNRLGIGFGETTPDGRFTLVQVACLGVCEQAPAMMINEKLYTNLVPERIDAILKEYE